MQAAGGQIQLRTKNVSDAVISIFKDTNKTEKTLK